MKKISLFCALLLIVHSHIHAFAPGFVLNRGIRSENSSSSLFSDWRVVTGLGVAAATVLGGCYYYWKNRNRNSNVAGPNSDVEQGNDGCDAPNHADPVPNPEPREAAIDHSEDEDEEKHAGESEGLPGIGATLEKYRGGSTTEPEEEVDVSIEADEVLHEQFGRKDSAPEADEEHVPAGTGYERVTSEKNKVAVGLWVKNGQIHSVDDPIVDGRDEEEVFSGDDYDDSEQSSKHVAANTGERDDEVAEAVDLGYQSDDDQALPVMPPLKPERPDRKGRFKRQARHLGSARPQQLPNRAVDKVYVIHEQSPVHKLLRPMLEDPRFSELQFSPGTFKLGGGSLGLVMQPNGSVQVRVSASREENNSGSNLAQPNNNLALAQSVSERQSRMILLPVLAAVQAGEMTKRRVSRWPVSGSLQQGEVEALADDYDKVPQVGSVIEKLMSQPRSVQHEVNDAVYIVSQESPWYQSLLRVLEGPRLMRWQQPYSAMLFRLGGRILTLVRQPGGSVQVGVSGVRHSTFQANLSSSSVQSGNVVSTESIRQAGRSAIAAVMAQSSESAGVPNIQSASGLSNWLTNPHSHLGDFGNDIETAFAPRVAAEFGGFDEFMQEEVRGDFPKDRDSAFDVAKKARTMLQRNATVASARKADLKRVEGWFKRAPRVMHRGLNDIWAGLRKQV